MSAEQSATTATIDTIDNTPRAPPRAPPRRLRRSLLDLAAGVAREGLIVIVVGPDAPGEVGVVELVEESSVEGGVVVVEEDGEVQGSATFISNESNSSGIDNSSLDISTEII